MKRITIALVVGALLAGIFLGRASASTPTGPDAGWWANLSHDEKGVAVQASADGFTTGRADGYYLAGQAFAARLKDAGMPDEKASRFALETIARLPVAKFSRHSLADFVDVIDATYTRFPRAQNLTLGQIMVCLRDDYTGPCRGVTGTAP